MKIAREVFLAMKSTPAVFADLLGMMATLLPSPPIVEGVEDAADADVIGRSTLLQGYYFSRPLDPCAVPGWLDDFPLPRTARRPPARLTDSARVPRTVARSSRRWV